MIWCWRRSRDSAAARLFYAEYQLDESCFARAVRADQRNYFTGPNVEIDARDKIASAARKAPRSRRYQCTGVNRSGMDMSATAARFVSMGDVIIYVRRRR